MARTGDAVVEAKVVATVVVGAMVQGAMEVGAIVVGALVVQMPKKTQGSYRSLGTPPKAKVRLAISRSVIFIMRWQNEEKC